MGPSPMAEFEADEADNGYVSPEFDLSSRDERSETPPPPKKLKASTEDSLEETALRLLRR